MHSNLTPSQISKFWSRVHKSDSCWLWTGHRSPDGYGLFHAGGFGTLTLRAHRVAWFLSTGTWPVMVRHFICDNPPCVRFDHLREGDHQSNMADKIAKGRQAIGAAVTANRNHATGRRNGAHTHPETRARGERNGASKLSAVQVQSIRALYAQGAFTQRQLAEQFKISQGLVWQIVRGNYWPDV